MSLPNKLTLFRLASAPLFLALFIGSGKDGFLSDFIEPQLGLLLCMIVVFVSESSDVLDGIIARKFDQVTDFGKILDPYADSTFRLSCFFAFASNAHGVWIPIWMVMVLFYRDLMVTVIRAFGIERRIFVQARASGKIKAVVQATVVMAVMVMAYWKGEDYVAYNTPDGSYGVARGLMWIVTAMTLWSAVDYFWANRHLFSKDLSGEKNKKEDETSPQE